MAKTARQISDQVTALVEPIVEELEFELVDVEYVTERGRHILRIYVDKEGGITVDDCAFVSNEIGDLIDVKEIIPHGYVLEVSSPGLNRPLKKEKDFHRAVGRKIKFRTTEPIKGQKNFTGYLRECSGGEIVLDLPDRRVRLSLETLEKANLVYEFDEFSGEGKI